MGNNLVIDSRIRLDVQNDDGYMLILTYHFLQRKIEFDFRFEGMPIVDSLFHLVKPFLYQMIGEFEKRLHGNITTIERDMYLAIIKHCKEGISHFK